MTLGTQIKNIRMQAKLTQTQVADALNITRNGVSAWEIDRVDPSVENLRKLSALFSVTIADLFADTLPLKVSKAKSSKVNNARNIRIPIRGYAQGNYIDVGNAVKKPIGYLELAPSFANIVDLYAVYITGNSMSPAHDNGDTRLVTPHTPCKIGDTVVIVKKASDGKPETSYIKTFTEIRTLASGRTMLHFNQNNPQAELIFDQENIIQMHKVITYNELLGL